MSEEETSIHHKHIKNKQYDYTAIVEQVDNLIQSRNEISNETIEAVIENVNQNKLNVKHTEIEQLEKPEGGPESPSELHKSIIPIPSTEFHEFPTNNIKSIEKQTKKQIVKEQQSQSTGGMQGIGWKGQGSRQIIYDETLDEYIYIINEPSLTKTEKTLLNHVIYLFGINVNVDVHGHTEQEKSLYLEKALLRILKDNHITIDKPTQDKIFYHIFKDFIGYGKIDILMHDDVIEDISCDGTNIPIFIYHRELETIRSNIIFTSSEELDNYVVKLAQICGKQISIYDPIVDGKLEDGSRLSVTLSNTVTQDSNFTIRRFREEPLTPIDLIKSNTLTIDMAAYFWLAIENNTSILFCGGTASGKTTTLNALALFIPSKHKIVSIEDTREVNLPHENWIAGTTRTGFSQSEERRSGKDIDMFDLTRAALRQRPKVIIVGEVRGREAYTLFQAMTTGHLSYSTVHAGNIRTLIQRLESPPINLPRSLLTALDVVVFLNSVMVNKKPVRRISSVMEIIKLDPGSNRLITFTPFQWISDADDRFINEDGSRVLERLRHRNGWTEEHLLKELAIRKQILEWMIDKDIKSYKNVSQVISDYYKNPEKILKLILRDMT
jgi:flagellar protein FlaI